jgi:hypothetical protein
VRERVAEYEAQEAAAVDNCKELARRIVATPAKTTAGVMAKLLAAAKKFDEDALYFEGDAPVEIAMGAALDALALSDEGRPEFGGCVGDLPEDEDES